MAAVASSGSGVSSCTLLVWIVATAMAVLPISVMGREVTVVSTVLAPYLTRHKYNGTFEYDGFLKELLDEVGLMANVTFVLSTNNEFGRKTADGKWTGIMKDVVTEKVKMAAAPLTVTSERRNDVAFSVPFKSFGPVIIMKRPSSSTPTFEERFQRIFAPLSHSVWLMSLLAYFVTSVILYIICHYNPYEWRHLFKDRQATLREAESFNCQNAFWFALSTWMWQGYIRAPRSLGGRLVVTSWWMFVVVFLVTYTASLTNLLRVGPRPLEDEQYVRILSLEDLAKQNEVAFGFVKSGSTESFFKNAQVPYLRGIWKEVNRRGSMMSVEDGLEMVRTSLDSSPFAFVMESAMASYQLRQPPCDLYMVGDLSVTGSYAFAYKPGWDLAHTIDMALLYVKENGLLKALEDKWFSGRCSNNVLDHTIRDKIQVSPFYSVSLGAFSGVLVVLLGGVFAGALVTVIEVVIYRKAELPSPDDEAATPMKGREAGKTGNKGDNISAAPGGAASSSAHHAPSSHSRSQAV